MSDDKLCAAQGRWPSGCHDPDSCARHQRCMYVQCHRNGHAIAPGEIKEALSRSGNNDGSAKPVLPGPSETLNPRQDGTHNGALPQRAELKPFKSLINEVAGVWDAFEIGLRQEISNTNYAVVKEKLAEAESALEAMLRPAAGAPVAWRWRYIKHGENEWRYGSEVPVGHALEETQPLYASPQVPSPADKAPVAYETWMETVRAYNHVKAELQAFREAVATIPPLSSASSTEGKQP